jgi:hypothetical protein
MGTFKRHLKEGLLGAQPKLMKALEEAAALK